MHPLAADSLTYREYGKQHTLPTFWFLCEHCEQLHVAGDVAAMVAAMRGSEWSWVEDDDAVECVLQPLNVFREADLGARPLDS